jgi:hypothetical protein
MTLEFTRKIKGISCEVTKATIRTEYLGGSVICLFSFLSYARR